MEAPPATKSRSVLIGLMGAVSAWISTFGFTSDFMCRAWGGAVAGGILGALAAHLGPKPPAEWKWLRTRYRVVLAICLGAAVGLPYRPHASAEFTKAFGFEPPRGIRDLQVTRCFGGPDSASFISFVADRELIDRLLSTQPSHNREILEQHPPSQDWDQFWTAVMGAFFSEADHAGRSWRSVPPMTSPRVLHWSTWNADMTLVLDVDTG